MANIQLLVSWNKYLDVEFGFVSINACNFIYPFGIESPMISFLNHVEDISSHGATSDNAGYSTIMRKSNGQVLTMCAYSKFF